MRIFTTIAYYYGQKREKIDLNIKRVDLIVLSCFYLKTGFRKRKRVVHPSNAKNLFFDQMK
jgi:hypothetical protein